MSSTPVNYGVTTEAYIQGLESELAWVTGKTEADQAHRAEIEAELKTARAQPKTTNVQGTPLE